MPMPLTVVSDGGLLIGFMSGKRSNSSCMTGALFTGQVGQAIIAAVVPASQLLVIAVERVQNRRVKIVNVNPFLGHRETVLVRGTGVKSGLVPRASHAYW